MTTETTYRIEFFSVDGSQWTSEAIGDARGWDSCEDAERAVASLGGQDQEWWGLYRIVDETSGNVVSEINVGEGSPTD